MKVTKYAQSCLLIQTDCYRILVDPGTAHYDSSLLEDDWINLDFILVTQKHPDHCNVQAIEEILKRDSATLYSSHEVFQTYSTLKGIEVGQQDQIVLDSLTITVTKAVHEYLTGMHETNREILENIGFILDDGKTKLYFTSDTIHFYNDLICDVIAMPFNENGLTLGLIDGVEFLKHTNAKLVLPLHDNPPRENMKPDFSLLAQRFDEENISYCFLKEKEMIDLTEVLNGNTERIY